MSYKLEISYHAYLDLQEATNYISHALSNPSAADRLLAKISEVMHDLLLFPNKHPLVKDEVLKNLKIRFAIVDNYYLFYRTEKDKIILVRFLYKNRNWVNLLNEDNM